jgi:hypothetical protein
MGGLLVLPGAFAPPAWSGRRERERCLGRGLSACLSRGLLLPGGWGDCHPDHEFDLRRMHGVDLRWWWRRLEVLALGEAGQ